MRYTSTRPVRGTRRRGYCCRLSSLEYLEYRLALSHAPMPEFQEVGQWQPGSSAPRESYDHAGAGSDYESSDRRLEAPDARPAPEGEYGSPPADYNSPPAVQPPIVGRGPWPAPPIEHDIAYEQAPIPVVSNLPAATVGPYIPASAPTLNLRAVSLDHVIKPVYDEAPAVITIAVSVTRPAVATVSGPATAARGASTAFDAIIAARSATATDSPSSAHAVPAVPGVLADARGQNGGVSNVLGEVAPSKAHVQLPVQSNELAVGQNGDAVPPASSPLSSAVPDLPSGAIVGGNEPGEAVSSIETTIQRPMVLAGMSLNFKAVDAAMDAVIGEIEEFGGELIAWLDDVTPTEWVIGTAAALFIAAGRYYWKRRLGNSADEDRIADESSSWLFTRLQTPQG